MFLVLTIVGHHLVCQGLCIFLLLKCFLTIFVCEVKRSQWDRDSGNAVVAEEGTGTSRS